MSYTRKIHWDLMRTYVKCLFVNRITSHDSPKVLRTITTLIFRRYILLYRINCMLYLLRVTASKNNFKWTSINIPTDFCINLFYNIMKKKPCAVFVCIVHLCACQWVPAGQYECTVFTPRRIFFWLTKSNCKGTYGV